MKMAVTRIFLPVWGLWLLMGVEPVLGEQKSVIIGFHPVAVASPSGELSAMGAGTAGLEPDTVDLATVLPPDCVITRRYTLIPAVAARVPESQIEALQSNPAIAYVEDNAVYEAAVASAPTAEGDDSWQVRRVAADAAHAAGVFGTGVKVAVLDTGVDYRHTDLDQNYRGGYDFVFSDNDPMDDSTFSHGTHVAGIIAAEWNGVGVVGVAPNAGLYAAKVLDGAGFGREEWIIAGIEWAVAQGVDIINMSLTGPDRQGLREACDAARDAGVLLVAAGGNSLAGGGAVKYPAAYPSVIAVTATDALDLPGYFAPVGDQVELAAPGVEILSTAAGGKYHVLSGTSQAAACVSGAAALFFETLDIDLTRDDRVESLDVQLMLRLTSTDLGNLGFDRVYGFGLLNAWETSFDLVSTTRLVRLHNGPPREEEVVTAELTDAFYCVTLANNRLMSANFDVFEGETYREDLSRVIRFARGGQRNNVFWLDATGTHLTLRLTPYGLPGAFATLYVERPPSGL